MTHDHTHDGTDTRPEASNSNRLDGSKRLDGSNRLDGSKRLDGPKRSYANVAAGGLNRRDYLRALGVASASGVLGSTVATPASAQSDLDEAAADQRILENQTGPLTVEVVDGNGDPVSGASVDVEMRDHEFSFGTAIGADLLMNEFDSGEPYREHLLELFNTAVFGNDHKWAFFEDGQALVDEAVDWLDERGFDVRGHTCVYPVDYAVPGDVMRAVDRGDAETIRRRSLDHIEDVITNYGDQVMEWDVVNEVLHRGLLHSGVYPDQIDLDDLPAGEIQPWRSQLLADWYGHAESVIDQNDLDVEIVTNDYNTMTWSYARDRYVEQLSFLESQGIDLDGIGLQAHVGGLKDGSQEWTYSAIDSVFEHYSQFDAAQRITEFDMFGENWTDQQQRADALERFLKTAYGHPDVDEFLIWGMWDESHWENEAPFFYADWSEKPALDVWRTLVLEEWWTSEPGTTGGDGTCTVDAFYGEYEVGVTAAEQQRTVELSHVDEQGDGTRIVVSLDVDDEEPCTEAAGSSTEVDGQTVCDLNDDGYYRDVTSDGSVGQGDVAEFFSKQHRDAWKRPELFDFSGNGAVTHGDVVELADYVALN